MLPTTLVAAATCTGHTMSSGYRFERALGLFWQLAMQSQPLVALR